MKSRFRTRHAAIALLILGAVLPRSTPVTGGEEAPEKLSFSTDPQDATACQKQLSRIYAAIQEYQRTHQQLPNRLSVLVPDFIRDPEELICPYVKGTGDVSGWRYHVGQDVFDDPNSTYAHEFANRPHHAGRTVTLRELKQRHMAFFGFGVPIVRCMAHRPRLNLAYDGTLYESDFEWEDSYLLSDRQKTEFHDAFLSPDFPTRSLLEASIPKRAQIDLTKRQLDLSGRYNAPLLHLARIDPRGRLLMTYPRSVECIAGHLFDVRGVIHLGGKGFPIAFPSEIRGIPVRSRCARLHFLHGIAQFPPAAPRSVIPGGTTNVIYSIQYEDGPAEQFSIVQERDVKCIWFNPDDPSELERPKVAWVSAPQGAGVGRTALRLYLKTWQNPFPDRFIQSVSLASTATNGAPFLLAITLE